MKIKCSLLNEIDSVLKTVVVTAEVPFSNKRKIRKMIVAIELEAKMLSEEVKDVLKKYAQKDEEGEVIVARDGSMKVDNASMQKLNSELEELGKLEIEIDIEKVTLPEEAFDKVKCSADAIQFIEENFIEERNEENKDG